MVLAKKRIQTSLLETKKYNTNTTKPQQQQPQQATVYIIHNPFETMSDSSITATTTTPATTTTESIEEKVNRLEGKVNKFDEKIKRSEYLISLKIARIYESIANIKISHYLKNELGKVELTCQKFFSKEYPIANANKMLINNISFSKFLINNLKFRAPTNGNVEYIEVDSYYYFQLAKKFVIGEVTSATDVEPSEIQNFDLDSPSLTFSILLKKLGQLERIVTLLELKGGDDCIMLAFISCPLFSSVDNSEKEVK